MEAERSRQEVVPTAAFACFWREISSYGEHSESIVVVGRMEACRNQPLNHEE